MVGVDIYISPLCLLNTWLPVNYCLTSELIVQLTVYRHWYFELHYKLLWFCPVKCIHKDDGVSRLIVCAFGAAAARIWNSLSPTVTSAATLNSLKKHLKTHLFHCSYPSLWLYIRLAAWTVISLLSFLDNLCRFSRKVTIWVTSYPTNVFLGKWLSGKRL